MAKTRCRREAWLLYTTSAQLTIFCVVIMFINITVKITFSYCYVMLNYDTISTPVVMTITKKKLYSSINSNLHIDWSYSYFRDKLVCQLGMYALVLCHCT